MGKGGEGKEGEKRTETFDEMWPVTWKAGKRFMTSQFINEQRRTANSKLKFVFVTLNRLDLKIFAPASTFRMMSLQMQKIFSHLTDILHL